jgi:hypothetical protein
VEVFNKITHQGETYNIEEDAQVGEFQRDSQRLLEIGLHMELKECGFSLDEQKYQLYINPIVEGGHLFPNI